MRLASVEDALLALQQIQAGQTTDFEEIVLAGELAGIKIKVDGPRYNGTIPAELARGIWELQASLYRASAFALTGVEDSKRLGADQRKDLELVFKVSEGSSDLFAPLGKFAESLGEGFKNLEPKLRAAVLIAIVVIVAGGVLSWKALGDSADTKKAEIEASTRISTEQEKTRQFEVLAGIVKSDPKVAGFAKASEEGTTAILKAVPDATSLKIGRADFSREDIQEVNQRSARVSSVSTAVTDEYLVFNSESKLPHATRFVLVSTDGTEFPVLVIHSEFTPDDVKRLWTAAIERTRIRLEVAITKNRDTVKLAQIIQFL